MTYLAAPPPEPLPSEQTPGPDHSAGGHDWKPVRKVAAGIVAWLGSSAGLAVLDAVGAAIPTEAVWGVVAGGAVANLAAYLRKSQG